MKPFIRRATGLDAIRFAPVLRPEDALELQTAHPEQQLWSILTQAVESGESYLWADNPDFFSPYLLCGVVPVELGIGTIWMVATDGIKGHAISILREARHWLTYWHEQYSLLVNQVECRNILHLRWLQLLGARVDPDADIRNGQQVLTFYL